VSLVYSSNKINRLKIRSFVIISASGDQSSTLQGYWIIVITLSSGNGSDVKNGHDKSHSDHTTAARMRDRRTAASSEGFNFQLSAKVDHKTFLTAPCESLSKSPTFISSRAIVAPLVFISERSHPSTSSRLPIQKSMQRIVPLSSNLPGKSRWNGVRGTMIVRFY